MERMNTGAQPAAKVASQPAGAAAPQSASQRPVVRLEHARKAFGGNQVLNDISLSVSPGEVVAIIGPSGGGKSTLLRCMTLLERLDGGGLWYGGGRRARGGAPCRRRSTGPRGVRRQGHACPGAPALWPGVSEFQPVSPYERDAQYHGRSAGGAKARARGG